MFKRSDLIIILTVLALGILAAVIVRLAGTEAPGLVEIRVNGQLTATLDLYADRELTVAGYDGGEVHVSVTGSSVNVTSASCPDKICVNHSTISRTGESIICLPNRVVITVAAGGSAPDGLDAVSGR